MIGLKVLLVSPLLLDVKASGCLAKRKFAPQINYEVIKEPVKFQFNHTKEHLTRRSEERIEEWKQKHSGNAWVARAKDAKWHTEGLAVGGMKIKTRTEMVAYPYDMYGAYYCPYVKTLNVEIIYSTEIFIAREIEKGTCEFDAVLEHEFKHHDTNWTVVQTLADRMEADTPKIIAYMERRYFPRGKIDQAFEYIQEGIRDALQVYSEEISARKEEFNALVDTPEEYKRVSEMCEHQHDDQH